MPISDSRLQHLLGLFREAAIRGHRGRRATGSPSKAQPPQHCSQCPQSKATRNTPATCAFTDNASSRTTSRRASMSHLKSIFDWRQTLVRVYGRIISKRICTRTNLYNLCRLCIILSICRLCIIQILCSCRCNAGYTGQFCEQLISRH